MAGRSLYSAPSLAGFKRMSSKRQEPKYKINRRLQVNLWGRPKSPLNRREYGRSTRAAAQEAIGFRYAACREAEAEGLLRKYERAPVSPTVRRGGTPPRRHGRQSYR